MTTTTHKQTTALPHSITCVDAQYIQPGVACLYLLEHRGKVCIIETGTNNSIPYIQNALHEIDRTFADVAYIIPTHIHLDHAGGAGGLMQLCDNAQLIIHPRGAYHMAHPEKLQAGTIAVYGEEKFNRVYGELIPVAEDRIIEAPDEFEIDFEGRLLGFLDTPGHALHHFCIHDVMNNGIFTGDTFGLAYKQFDSNNGPFLFATTTPVHFDPEALLSSIDRLIALDPKTLYLTHFCAITPNDKAVNQLKQSIQAFVDIALNAQHQHNRMDVIESEILDWIVEQSRHYAPAMPDKKRTQLLATDANLNAQGIEVWLQRKEKESSHH